MAATRATLPTVNARGGRPDAWDPTSRHPVRVDSRFGARIPRSALYPLSHRRFLVYSTPRELVRAGVKSVFKAGSMPPAQFGG